MAETRCVMVLLCASFAVILGADNRFGGRRGVVSNLLREMVNQTKADTLNLPANASSIRENITDTFSCENRTYGYYADVDNECQVFHVCLTRESKGHNTTYRWSFICPNETVFNQEVLTCTYPRDSINCEDSPMFYHLNMEIGKVNDTEGTGEKQKENKRKQPVRKQNIVVNKLMKEVKNEKLVVEDLSEELSPVIEETVENPVRPDEEVEKPVIHEVNGEYTMVGGNLENSRLLSERSFKKRGRQSRGSFRFKADV